MKSLFILFFILSPILLEIYLLIKIGAIIGPVFTLFWIFFTGILGFVILKNKFKNLFRPSFIKQEIQKNDFLNQILYLTAGIFLIVPGFFSDLLGLSIFFSFIRRIYSKILKTLLIKQFILKRIQFHTFRVNPKEPNSWKASGFDFKSQKQKFNDFMTQNDSMTPKDFHSSDSHMNSSKPLSNVIDFNSRKKKIIHNKSK